MSSLRTPFTSALALASSLLAFGAEAVPRSSGADYCSSFGASLQLQDTKVLQTTYYSNAQTYTVVGADPTCDSTAEVSVPLCRLTLLVDTSASSQVQIEVYLPDDWSGRVASVGNGGLNGCTSYSDLNYLSSLNFAVVGSNNGHNSTSGASFFNSPEVVKDFAYRAVYTETVLSKQIVKSYYKRAASKAYWMGCSTGGRQGFKAVQDFPELFDGVLAGAPAIDFNHLLGWEGILGTYVGAPHGDGTEQFISKPLWARITQNQMEQCDEIDGVKDGVIDNPDRCDYRPEEILCDAITKEDELCLTPLQAEIVRKIFSPLYGLNGELLYPRYDPGTPVLGSGQAIFSGALMPYTVDWWKYVIYSNLSYTGSDFNLQSIADADAVDPAGISTFKPDLSGFRAAGGKVIHWHGRQDALIASGNSFRYLAAVQRAMGPSALTDFYRFFPVPGVDHCTGGAGANVFGQVGGAFRGIPSDSRHNLMWALVDWVERGIAPDEVVGTRFVNDTVALGVESQRVHCAYPNTSVLTEGADRLEASSWECI